MTFEIKLDAFEGPLDLLLHLIREHQINILDIPIATITDAYLERLARMQELDLDVAGEYLLMAATLIHIKSKMLLPPEETVDGEEILEPEDPRAELVSRLLEYQKFKEAAQTLGLLESEASLLYRRGSQDLELEIEGPLETSMVELLKAFRRVLARAETAVPLEITPEELNVGQCVVTLVDRLAVESPLEFSRLFDQAARRVEVIVTFLALLELLRRRLATARQPDALGPIMIYRLIEAADAADAPQPAEGSAGVEAREGGNRE